MNTVEETVLDETILDDEPECQSAQGCPSTAEWSCVMRCCKDSAILCTRCLIKSRSYVVGHPIKCMSCGHYFGYSDYEDIVKVIPLWQPSCITASTGPVAAATNPPT